MSLQRAWLPTAILISLMAAGASLSAAQDPAQPQPDQNSPTAARSPTSNLARDPAAPTAASPEPPAPVGIAPAHKTYTVPAGTKVLLELRSAINTKSAKARRRRLPFLHLSRGGRQPRHDSRRRLRAGRG